MLLVLLISLVIGVVLTGGCVSQETPTQIIEDITPQEAFTLIQNNKNNPDFVILDVRTPEEFADGHLENATNLDYYSETFRDELNKLDKDKTYLVYCRSGKRSRNAVDIMEELNFKEAYNMTGGIIQWLEEDLPILQETSVQIIEDITPQEAFTLIQNNKNNPDFVILDVRTPEAFADGHIENAINIKFPSETFRDELNALDKNKTYLVYCATGSSGCGSVGALDIMEEFNFREAYNLSGGINQWKAEGLPLIE